MKRLKENFFRNNNSFILRVHILSVVVVALFLIVLLRLFQIQIVDHNIYKVLAQSQHELFEKTIPKRGEIFINDAYSNKLYPLATNKEMSLVYAVPKNIVNKKEVAAKLSELLELEEIDVFNIINKEDDPYEVIKRKVQNETAEKIKSENIVGVKISPEIIRYYPGNYLAANVVGFVGYSGHKVYWNKRR